MTPRAAFVEATISEASGVSRYLNVRYHPDQRPYTEYPHELTRYLAEQYLRDKAPARLLDLGCGRGEFLHGFAQLGFDAVGVDRALIEHHPYSEPIVQTDYERASLPFAEGAFDVIFSKSVFEHVLDIATVLHECFRVLRPGGQLLAMVPDWKSQWSHFYDDWTHVRPFTLTGLSECLRCHGFDIRDARVFRQLPFLWHRPYLLPAVVAVAQLPAWCKRFKTVRFAKETMLLVVANKPSRSHPQTDATNKQQPSRRQETSKAERQRPSPAGAADANRLFSPRSSSSRSHGAPVHRRKQDA